MRNILLLIFVFFGLQAGCKKESINELSVSPDRIEFPKEGGIDSIVIRTDADNWQINDVAEWIKLSQQKGKQKTTTVKITVSTISSSFRSDTFTVTAGNAKAVKVIVTQQPSEILYSLTVNKNQINFNADADSTLLEISSDAPQWTITTSADWLTFSSTNGQTGKTIITVYSSENPDTKARNGIFSIQAKDGPIVEVSVNQQGGLYPTYNTSPLAPDSTGMTSNALQLAKKIKLGWNLGNSLEAIGGETAWGNPKTTKALIDLVKNSGFNAIRIPCSWNQYVVDQNTAEINIDWLERVKEVVQYCIDNDMYVILNIHWDGGWLENNCTETKKAENNAKQKAFWQQIATHLRNFDEHLLFASANEPNVDNASQMDVLMSYHQTFINAVRSTGGKNSFRTLVIQGPSTDIDKTYQLMNTLPKDKISNRLMVEIHYYTPWNFCGLTEDASWGKMFYFWGKDYHSTTNPERNATWGEEETVDSKFLLMKKKFVDKGIPVVLGEFSATRRANLSGDELQLHLASRAYFHKYVAMRARENGLIPFFWDNGGIGNYGCAIFDRNTLTIYDTLTMQGLLEAIGTKK